MASIAEVVADAKDGIWQRLTTTAGLTDADNVTVRSATIAPEELAPDTIILGDATIGSSGRPDLVGESGSVTLNGWVMVTRHGGDEPAIQAARRRAALLMAAVKQTVASDPTVDGTIAGPGGTAVNVSALEESPLLVTGQAFRRATYPFSITWTSHI
jgi:hypothetical protein